MVVALQQRDRYIVKSLSLLMQPAVKGSRLPITTTTVCIDIYIYLFICIYPTFIDVCVCWSLERERATLVMFRFFFIFCFVLLRKKNQWGRRHIREDLCQAQPSSESI